MNAQRDQEEEVRMEDDGPYLEEEGNGALNADGDNNEEEETSENNNNGDALEILAQHWQREQQQEQEAAPIMGPLDPRRMQIFDEERDWAIAIKDAALATPELDPVTDFWYAQLAIVDKDDIESALERLHHLQAFRQEYDVRDRFEEGRRCLHKFVGMFPRHILSYSFNFTEGCFVFITDQSATDLGQLSSVEQVSEYLKHAYYFATVFNPDLEGVRRGASFLLECEGFDWAKHVSADTYKRLWTELACQYPMNFNQVKHFHTGMFYNLLLSLTKRFLPQSIRSKLLTGCQFDQRLDTLYLVPTVEIANQRLLARLENCLSRRYENEATFSLLVPPPLSGA